MEAIAKAFASLDWVGIAATVVQIAIILLVARVFLSIFQRPLKQLEQHLMKRGEAQGQAPEETSKRAETLSRLLRQTVAVAVWVTTGLVILRELGVEIAPVLASAGVAGLAVGFGAQNLVRDIISGFFLILENQVRVGDVAIINGTGGLVEQINLRTIVLRDLTGTVHVFPNGTVSTLANLTQVWSAHVFEIGVAYKEDTDRVVEVIRRVGRELKADETFGPLILEDMEVFGVDAFGDSAVVIKGRIKTTPIQQWTVGREFLRRVKKAFDAEGIEIPFPHRSIYFGEASQPFLAKLLDSGRPAPAPASASARG
jgi:moderate conductance mechanosensitive channel